MRIKIASSVEGPVPSEAVVTIPTLNGNEDVVVHKSQVTAGAVEVGFIGKKEDEKAVLVELPRETVSGRWRLWVPEWAIA